MGRMEKVNQLIKREISQMIQRDLTDPRLQFVTVTSVDVSPDLRHARVKYSVLGDAAQLDAAAAALKNARGYIRRQIGQRVKLRYTPEVDFIYDQSIAYSIHMDETLDALRRERGEDAPDDAGSGKDGLS